MKFITKFIIKLFFEIYVNKIYLYVGNRNICKYFRNFFGHIIPNLYIL